MKRKLIANDGNKSRTGHWKDARSRFRGTRTMPYAYWGGECQSERAHALSERTPFRSCVLDRTRREREWMTKTSTPTPSRWLLRMLVSVIGWGWISEEDAVGRKKWLCSCAVLIIVQVAARSADKRIRSVLQVFFEFTWEDSIFNDRYLLVNKVRNGSDEHCLMCLGDCVNDSSTDKLVLYDTLNRLHKTHKNL